MNVKNTIVNKLTVYLFLFLILLLAVIMLSVNTGSVKLPLLKILTGFDNKSPYYTIFYQVRLPRIILAALVGASLALAGVSFQGVLRNPLADPYIVGTSAGSAVGAAISIIWFPNVFLFGFSLTPVIAFITSLITMLFIFHVSKIDKKIPVEQFLLSGVMAGSFMWALVTIIFLYAKNDISKIVYWMMGSLSYQNWDYVMILLPYFILSFIVLLCYSHYLNILSLGEEKAFHLGLNIEKVKMVVLLFACLITSATVSVCGLIGFVGLIIPHMLRLYFGYDYRLLIPFSVFLGAVFLIIADTVSRTVIYPSEIPVGVFTALLGVPFFFYLLKKRKRSY